MRTLHTPGPWFVVECDSTTLHIDDQFGIEGGRDYYLVEIRHGDEDELRANARLVAAAPDLLALVIQLEAACEAALNDELEADDDLDAQEFWEDGMKACRAAIAKATGQE